MKANGATTARVLAAVSIGFQTSADIAMATRIDRTTVSARLNLLARQGKIVSIGYVPSKKKPTAKRWRKASEGDGLDTNS